MKRENDKAMVQSAVRLPRSLHERLKKAGGRRGMGEEIRRRLEYALEAAETPADEITGELLDQIREIARDLSDLEEWHSSRFVFDVFKAAVEALLARHQPSDETKAETIAHLKAVWGDKEPEEMGRFIAGAAAYAHARERVGKAFLEGPPGSPSWDTEPVKPAGPAARLRVRFDEEPPEGTVTRAKPGSNRVSKEKRR
jgi:hypothetical protein